MTLDTGLDTLANAFGLTVISSNENTNGESGDATSSDSTLPPVGSLNTSKHIYADSADDEGRYTWLDKFPEAIEDAAENEETARHAIVVRNIKSFDSRKRLEIHSIVIQSPWLKKALGEILKDYPAVTCELERLVFDAPFEPFVHRWGDLLKFMNTELDEKTKEHMNLLHGILAAELKDTISAFEDYMAHGVITFQHLWMVFQPGSIVISHQSGTPSAYELRGGCYTVTRCGKAYQLGCECVEWGGEYFGRGGEDILLYEFKGTKAISTLKGVPLAFYPEREALKMRLIQRGKKYEALAGFHYKAYKGAAIGWDSEENPIRVTVSGRIIIDSYSFNRFSPYRARYVDDLRESDKTTIIDGDGGDDTNEKDDDFLINVRRPKVRLNEALHLICSPMLRGYSMKSKKWLDFFVDLVYEISWNDSAFDSLVLPLDQKELIISFAESQVRTRQEFDDFVQGKGKGIIMLLSGPPGVGKTLTAESVAENMHVPLYMMSAGDLGLNPEEVEKRLADILEMVAKWNAILLLDECDVFMEARSSSDLERNKLVSIFLRILEYYEGILFLTTNRVDNIDAAFQSRIHVSMAYPNLTASSRRTVWKNFMETSKKPHTIVERDLDELAEVELNGRQIKNVLKTAQLLMMKRGGILSRDLIETILAIERRRP